MNRPEVRNAMNPDMIRELADALSGLSENRDLRVIIIRGKGGVFSSGADLKWMQESGLKSPDENRAENRFISDLMKVLLNVPVPLISVAEGAAFGGALGILACSDHVLAAADTRFGFSEVRLGLAPAIIMPYVMRRTTMPQVKGFMLTGRPFSALQAQGCGLADTVTEPVSLETVLNEIIETFIRLPGPALREIKRLWNLSLPVIAEDISETTIGSLTALKQTAEAQELLKRFFTKH
jgi:methylglutaconyl-CoA hydratase